MSQHIHTLESASHLSTEKHKFWNSSITGNTVQPKDKTLVEEKQIQLENQEDQEPNYLNEQDLEEGDSFDQTISNKTAKMHKEKIGNLEEEVEDVRRRLEEGRKLNQSLTKELNKVTNVLRSAQALNQELNSECDKLYTTVKVAHDRHSEVQNEKMELIIQISSLNQQKQLAMSKTQIFQQQVEYLNKKIQALHEENSFQKIIENDLKKQILVLKEQLNKLLVVMEDYSQLQQEVARTHTINYQIQKKVKNLEQQLRSTRAKVEQSQISEQKYRSEQNRLFLRIEELQNQQQILKEKLRSVEQEARIRQSMLISQGVPGDYQARYMKILKQYENRNENLIFELMAVNERNHKLLQERDFYQRRVEATITNRNERLPYDQFVTILKQKDTDYLVIKRKIQQKEEQIDILKNKHEQQLANYKQRITQLNNKIQMKDVQLNNKEILLTNEIQIYKKQCELLSKRNEENKNGQVKLRLQIAQKDKIIITFIQKQKAEEQIRRRQKQQKLQQQIIV